MRGTRLQHGEFFGLAESACEAEGYALCIKSADPRIAVERHTHEDAHFILLLDGLYRSTARGAGTIHAEPALIYNPPGTTHRDTFPEREGRFLAVSIAGARLAEVGELGRPPEGPVRIWDPTALGLAAQLSRLVVEPPSPFAVEATSLELVTAIVHGLREERRPPRWLRAAREVLHDRAGEPLTIATVARDARVHPVHLARAFRRFYGCTPADYLRRVRVEAAAGLIRRTARPLADIAVSCGFVDQSHLTRTFRRSFATTPAGYRRRHGGGR